MNYSTKLNELDILDLLNEYHAEMRKLHYKVAFVKSKITQLEEDLASLKRPLSGALVGNKEVFTQDEIEPSVVETVAPEAEKAEISPTKEKAKKVVKKTATKKPGRKLQPLSAWDQMIFDIISENGRALLSREILVFLIEKSIDAGLYESEDNTRIRLNQCLVKMTSENRKDLVKVNYSGRGYGYALPAWADDDGDALPEFAIKAEEAPKTKKEKKTAKKTRRRIKAAPQASSGTPKI